MGLNLIKYKNLAILLLMTLALFLILLIIRRYQKLHEGFAEGAAIPTPASEAWGMDIFKSTGIYDRSSLASAQLYPGKNSVDLLISQQKQRQHMMAVLNEKVEKNTANLAIAKIEIEKAGARLDIAKASEERAKKDFESAVENLAQVIIMQTFTVANQVSIDPSVIVRAAGALPNAIKLVTMATMREEDTRKWHKKMKEVVVQMDGELTEYTARGAAAAAELAKALKEMNEVKGFYAMSAEAEYINKQFFPYATPESAKNRRACDDLIPRSGN
jgi:hypothetical protein